MKRSTILSAAVACSLLLGTFANAQTVATDPVGFVQPFATSPNMLANSDTQVSIPFTRPPEFVGATTAATANTLTVSGSPWSNNQFVYLSSPTQHNTYFALIGPHSTTNPKEGRLYRITGNTTNQLTVTNGGDDLSTVAATTQILIIPYHTFDSAFPASDLNVSFTASPNPATRTTQVFIPPFGTAGINNPPVVTYYYFNGAWRLFGNNPTENHNDDLLPAAGYFVVRNGATGTTLTTLGSVLTKKLSIPLLTRTDTKQDNYVALLRPVDVALNDLGLITSSAFVSSPNPATRVDELLVFDAASAQINKPPTATYYYFNNAWRQFGQNPNTDFGATAKIPAGAGFIIRKGITAGGAPVYWTNAPTY